MGSRRERGTWEKQLKVSGDFSSSCEFKFRKDVMLSLSRVSSLKSCLFATGKT